VYPWRPDRVRNHVRLCFLAYWISARLGGEWRLAKEPGEVPRILRRLQTIRIGRLKVGDKSVAKLMTDIPKGLNDLLEKLGAAASATGSHAGESPAGRIGRFTTDSPMPVPPRGWEGRANGDLNRQAAMKMNHIQ